MGTSLAPKYIPPYTYMDPLGYLGGGSKRIAKEGYVFARNHLAGSLEDNSLCKVVSIFFSIIPT